MSPQALDPGTRSALKVLGAVFAVSTVLAFVLFWQYSRTLSYVRGSIGYCAHLADGQPPQCVPPLSPPAWTQRAFSPEECVDAAMGWAADCEGIKSMCDMYVEAVIRDCLTVGDRATYCDAIARVGETTEFGAVECRARGTRRDVDREACANAYRAIDAFCSDNRFERQLAEGSGRP